MPRTLSNRYTIDFDCLINKSLPILLVMNYGTNYINSTYGDKIETYYLKEFLLDFGLNLIKIPLQRYYRLHYQR